MTDRVDAEKKTCPFSPTREWCNVEKCALWCSRLTFDDGECAVKLVAISTMR